MSVVAKRLEWMDEDATWYGGTPRCARLDSSPPRESGTADPGSFRPMSIVATVAHLSYCFALVRRPFVKRFAVCYQTVFLPVTFVYFGQIAVWIKMKLCMQV